MKRIFNFINNRLKTVKELLEFMWEYKMWWMMPIIMVLLLIGILIIFTANTPAAVPFIYTLF
ncbi:MAG: DUF5989 family protein [Candidatus Omnitrophota bacterium]